MENGHESSRPRQNWDEIIARRVLDFDNSGDGPIRVPGFNGPLRVPGFDGIPAHYDLPRSHRFSHGVSDGQGNFRPSGVSDWYGGRLTAREVAMLSFMNDVLDAGPRVVKSDSIVAEELRRGLRDAVAPLLASALAVPDHDHGHDHGQKGQILHLVLTHLYTRSSTTGALCMSMVVELDCWRAHGAPSACASRLSDVLACLDSSSTRQISSLANSSGYLAIWSSSETRAPMFALCPTSTTCARTSTGTPIA